MTTSIVCIKSRTLNEPSGFRYFMTLIVARLHAELSKCIYSEHGFDAFILPVLGQVCHLFIIVSYCIPGSQDSHAAWAIACIRSRARYSWAIFPPVTNRVANVSSRSTASMNSSVTRTELFAFWY